MSASARLEMRIFTCRSVAEHVEPVAPRAPHPSPTSPRSGCSPPPLPASAPTPPVGTRGIASASPGRPEGRPRRTNTRPTPAAPERTAPSLQAIQVSSDLRTALYHRERAWRGACVAPPHMRRALVILNAEAGTLARLRTTPAAMSDELAGLFLRQDVAAEVKFITGPELTDTARQAASSREYDMIVAGGGDGTIN